MNECLRAEMSEMTSTRSSSATAAVSSGVMFGPRAHNGGRVDGDNTREEVAQEHTHTHTQRRGAVPARILSPFSQAKIQKTSLGEHTPLSLSLSLNLLPIHTPQFLLSVALKAQKEV